jgi:hypothetical protein
MKVLHRMLLLLGTVLVIATATSNVYAAQSIPYQGHLASVSGVDLDAAVSIEVRLYDSLIGGIGEGVANAHVIYAEQHGAVEVKDGVFRIGIGEGAPLDAKWTALPADDLIARERAYLELWVNDERLSPRQRVGSLPAAMHAERAKFVDELKTLPAITSDMIPNYDAGKISSGTFSIAQMPTLDASIIEDALLENHIPALDVGKFAVSGTLPVERLGSNYSASKITSGEIGVGLLPSNGFLVMGDIAVGSGVLTNGQHLNMPTGFVPAQCSFVFSPTETSGAVEGIDCQRTKLNASGNLECEVWEKSDCSGDRAYCNAMYMAVCKREG